MKLRKKGGTKFIAVLSFVALFLILEFVAGYIQKSQRPKFATPQEIAEYVYKGEPEAIILGKDSCFIFNHYDGSKFEFMISPCIDGKYEINTKNKSNITTGTSQLFQYVDFWQAEGSNDQYTIVTGRGYPGEITVYDNEGTEFYLFFNEKQVEGTEYAPFFTAVGYLDAEDLSSYTVTVSDSNHSESISVE